METEVFLIILKAMKSIAIVLMTIVLILGAFCTSNKVETKRFFRIRVIEFLNEKEASQKSNPVFSEKEFFNLLNNVKGSEIDQKSFVLELKSEVPEEEQKQNRKNSAKGKMHLMETVPEEPLRTSRILEKRKYLLKLTNQLRAQYHLNSLELDNDLSKVAQMHSEDMVRYDYFDHINKKGEAPSQRIQKANLGTLPCAENLVISNSLTRGHKILRESEPHFENTIGKEWTNVGIGITFNSESQYVVTILFSVRSMVSAPLSGIEKKTLKKQIVKVLLKNTYLRKEDEGLSNSIQNWIDSKEITPIFEYLLEKGHQKSMYRVRMTTSMGSKVSEQVGGNKQLKKSLPSFLTTVGIGINMSKEDVEVILIFYR